MREGVTWNVVIPGDGFAGKLAAGIKRKIGGASVVLAEYAGPGAGAGLCTEKRRAAVSRAACVASGVLVVVGGIAVGLGGGGVSARLGL